MLQLTEFCCTCLKIDSSLENIEEFDKNNITYKNKLAVCVANQDWVKEYKICKNCIVNLELAYNFIQTCLKSEELRKKQINKLIEQNTALELAYGQRKKLFQQKVSKRSGQTSDKKIKTISIVQSEETSEKIYEKDLSNSDEHVNDGHPSSDEEAKLLKKNYSKRKVPLTCEYCGKAFNRRQHYLSHIRAKHTFEKPYKCDLCDAKYTNSHGLLVHKRNHNNEKPFICSYCGKSFVCSGDLYHHSKIHLNKREYKCNLCDKSFNTASILRTHKICMHLDPKEWKYCCKCCERRFPIKSSLVTHMKRHIGIRECSCHICEKKFFDKPELSKHLKSHSNERFFKCNICEGKEYKNGYGLKKHMKIIHDIGTVKIVKPEKKFACPMCSKTFAFNNKLQKHLCTHTGIKPYKCQCCDKRFIENYYRKLHLKKKHNIDETTDQIN